MTATHNRSLEQTRIVMNNAKRWILSLAIGAAIEGALFGLCFLTARDLMHEGPDTPLSLAFYLASMWPAFLLDYIYPAFADAFVYVFIFGLPTLIYGCLAYALLRRAYPSNV